MVGGDWTEGYRSWQHQLFVPGLGQEVVPCLSGGFSQLASVSPSGLD